jgi:hypothetical protein
MQYFCEDETQLSAQVTQKMPIKSKPDGLRLTLSQFEQAHQVQTIITSEEAVSFLAKFVKKALWKMPLLQSLVDQSVSILKLQI